MNNRPVRILRNLIASILLTSVAACTPSYVNQEDLGTRSTSEQIVSHYSGKSVRYSNKRGGTPNIETYFAADGTYKLVSLTDNVFSLGTWETFSGIGPVNMLIQATTYYWSEGKLGSYSEQLSFVVYIQEDGTAKADQIGGGNFGQPKPTPGFRAEKRWNSLKRQAGL